MKNIAIIPARSGSKGLKDKNIKPLLDIPLLAYSIRAAKDSALFDEIMVSTDSDDYAQIAKDYGASVPFLRSAKTSSDTAGSWDVVTEVLSQYQTSGRYFDTICLLQPTSPLRIASDIIGGYQLFDQKNADAITAVCEMDHSPLWSMTLPHTIRCIELHQCHSTIDHIRQAINDHQVIHFPVHLWHIQLIVINAQITQCICHIFIDFLLALHIQFFQYNLVF